MNNELTGILAKFARWSDSYSLEEIRLAISAFGGVLDEIRGLDSGKVTIGVKLEKRYLRVTCTTLPDALTAIFKLCVLAKEFSGTLKIE